MTLTELRLIERALLFNQDTSKDCREALIIVHRDIKLKTMDPRKEDDAKGSR